jgi:Matrixin
MPGPLGLPCNTPQIDAGTLARTQSVPPGINVVSGQLNAGQAKFLILLDLSELITIEQPGPGRVKNSVTGEMEDVFVKGELLGTDADRPKKVLAKVQKIFAPFADVIAIELDTPEARSDRLLKARFGFPLVNDDGIPQVSKPHGQFYSPYYVGAGADGKSRSRVTSFKPIKGDEARGPTAYVFEGAIALVVMDYFDGKAAVNNIYATAIAHELGHNLGLQHTKSPTDIMFIYAYQTEKDQKAWMTAANEDKLRFSDGQVGTIRALLNTK